MTNTVILLPGETIIQALIRHGFPVSADGAVTIPPGTYIAPDPRQTRIIEHIPFLNPGDQQ